MMADGVRVGSEHGLLSRYPPRESRAGSESVWEARAGTTRETTPRPQKKTVPPRGTCSRPNRLCESYRQMLALPGLHRCRAAFQRRHLRAHARGLVFRDMVPWGAFQMRQHLTRQGSTYREAMSNPVTTWRPERLSSKALSSSSAITALSLHTLNQSHSNFS